MYFLNRIIKESDTCISVIYYRSSLESIILYFRKSCVRFFIIDKSSHIESLDYKRLPEEIVDVVVIGCIFYMRTINGVIQCYKLNEKMEFVYIKEIYLCKYQLKVWKLSIFKDCLMVVEDQNIGLFTSESEQTWMKTKYDPVDIKSTKDFITSIELDKKKMYFNTYENLVDITVHRTKIEVPLTSYLLISHLKSSFVFSNNGVLVIKKGKLFKTLEILVNTTILSYFIIENQNYMLLVTQNKDTLVFSMENLKITCLKKIKTFEKIFLIDIYLFIINKAQIKVFKIKFMEANLENPIHLEECLFSDDLTRDIANFDPMGFIRKKHTDKKEFEEVSKPFFSHIEAYIAFGEWLSCSLKEIFIKRKHIVSADTSIFKEYGNTVFNKPRIFIEDEQLALIQDTNIFFFVIFEHKLKLSKLESTNKSINAILFSNGSYLIISGDKVYPSSFCKSKDLHFTYSNKTIECYIIEGSSLKLVKNIRLDFVIEDLSVLNNFLIVKNGFLLKIFDYQSEKLVFLQILEFRISQMFLIRDFLYVLTCNNTVYIYKIDENTGYTEVPVKIDFQEKILNTRNNIFFCEKYLYLFVNYDFLVVDNNKSILDAFFHRNTLYVCSDTFFRGFRIDLKPNYKHKFETEVNKKVDEKEDIPKIILKYEEKRETYIFEEGMVPEENNVDILQKDKMSQKTTSIINIVKHDVGTTVSLCSKESVTHSRRFDQEIKRALIFGKNIICSTKFHCLVFKIGIKSFLCKDRIAFKSEILDITLQHEFIYILTEIHSIFKYKAVDNKMICVCSDVLNRKINLFNIVSDNQIVFSDKVGFIGILSEEGGKYNLDMNFYVGEATCFLRSFHKSILYETEEGKIGELRCVKDNISKVLGKMHRKSSSPIYNHVLRKTSYPTINALSHEVTSNFNLVADELLNFNILETINNSELYFLIRLIYDGIYTRKLNAL